MERRDLYRYASLAAKEAGADCESSRADWNRDQWWHWVTDKLVEHFKGEVCWEQFGESSFGILQRNDMLRKTLLSRYESFKDRGPAAPESREFFEQVNGLLVG